MRRLRDAACAYAYQGWAVLPLRPGSKQPLGSLVPHGKDEATSDLATVFRWWAEAPDANIGINCQASGMIALDIDPRHGGDDSLYELESELGKLPRTVEALSGGGGQHLLFHHPDCTVIGVLAPGLDVKDSGYIVAPPSIHPSGREYVWDRDPCETRLEELPDRWLAALQHRPLETTGELILDHPDPLRRIPAAIYVTRLTGREADESGFVQCPWHREGQEKTPSLKVAGPLWACYGCRAPHGKRTMGGNIFEFAGRLWDFPLPLRGIDFAEVRARLSECLL